MFDCDNACEFYAWTEPVARKEHRCCECSAPILKGEKHFHGRGKWEGSISVHRQHLLCCEACMWVRDSLEGECLPFGSLMDYRREYLADSARYMTRGTKDLDIRVFLRLLAKIRKRERQHKMGLPS